MKKNMFIKFKWEMSDKWMYSVAKDKNKKIILLKRIIIHITIVFGAVWIFWRWPRTHWSLTATLLTDQHSQSDKAINYSPDKIRHVLLISIDTCRADHFGCYGYSRNTTPHIDTLAAESTLFNHAVSPIPITLPAHCSMLTGTTPLYHNVHSNENYKLSASNVTLAEILHDNGFATAAVIGSFVLNKEFGLHQGFALYDDINNNVPEFKINDQRHAGEVSDRAIRWLDDYGNKNFFLFLHYYDPHTPYISHEQFKFTSLPMLTLPKDLYDSEIAYTDYHVGRVLDKLKEMKIYDSTLIILTADHGESLGDHGENSHAYFIYHSTLHVPLIIKVPGQTKSTKVHEPVSLVDILPTVCGFLGFESPVNIQGQDLSGLWRNGQQVNRDRYIYAESFTATKYHAAPLQALITRQHKYIHTTRPEVYDLWNDPDESENIIKNEPLRAKKYHDLLMQIIKKTDRSDSESKVNLDEQTLQRLESLGYVGGKINLNTQTASGKDDPKDLLEFQKQCMDFVNLYDAKKYVKAKRLTQKLIARRSEFYVRSMVGLAIVLATHENPRIRDIPAAISIAEHAAKSTDYSDAYALYALSAAYAAAERFERAIKIAQVAYDITIAEKEIWQAKEVRKAIERYRQKKTIEK